MKKNIILFLLGLILYNILAVCFQLPSEGSKLTAGIGLVLALFFSQSILVENNYQLSWQQKVSFLLPLTFFLIVTLIKTGDINSIWFEPYLLAYAMILLNIFVFRNLKKIAHSALFILLIVSYTVVFYDRWVYITSGEMAKKDREITVDNTSLLDGNKEQLTSFTGLENLKFIDKNFDSQTINSSKPYIFLGTWTETCAACKIAFRELIPILDEIENLDSYFIYQKYRRFDKNNFAKATNDLSFFKGQNVLADIDNDFSKAFDIKADPTLIIIDNQRNEIVYQAIGYSDFKEEKIKAILEKIKNLN